MSLKNDIQELLEANIISPETADNMRDFYQKKQDTSPNKIVIVFGILGAMLIGLGIILIIAHNWDQFSRLSKTILAFLPLVISQALCGYTILKKSGSQAWRESSGVLLFFAIGGCIAMIGQIYNIPGNLSSFLLTWMLLALPLIYILPSSAVSLMYWVGISYYACESSYWSYPQKESYWYWLLLAAALPYYIYLFKTKPKVISPISIIG